MSELQCTDFREKRKKTVGDAIDEIFSVKVTPFKGRKAARLVLSFISFQQ